MAQLSMMLRSPSIKTGIFWFGLWRENSSENCSPLARSIVRTRTFGGATPASASSSSMMVVFHPFGVGEVQSSIPIDVPPLRAQWFAHRAGSPYSIAFRGDPRMPEVGVTMIANLTALAGTTS